MPFGAAKLLRIVSKSDSKAKSATRADLGSSMLAALGRLCGRFPDLARAVRGGGSSSSSSSKKDGVPGVDVYLCGGGFRGFGSMLMHNDALQPYPIPLMGGYTVAGDVFAATKAMDRVNTSYDERSSACLSGAGASSRPS